MDKKEYIQKMYRYYIKNQQFPNELSENEKRELYEEFIKYSDYDSGLIQRLPAEYLREKILENNDFLYSIFKKSLLDEIFSDEKFVEELFKNGPQFLFAFYVTNTTYFESESLERIEKEYLTGIRESDQVDFGIDNIFMCSLDSVRSDYDICMRMLNNNINNFEYVKNEEILNNNEIFYKYIESNPRKAKEYEDRINTILDDHLFEVLMKDDLNNRTLITNEHYVNLINEKYNRFHDKFRNVSRENEKLRYDFIFNDLLFEKYPNIIESILRYDTDIVDDFIYNLNNSNILEYIDFYLKSFGNTSENIQYAIISYDKIKNVYDKTLADTNIEYNNNLKELIKRENNFNIQDIISMEKFNNFKKEYFLSKLENNSTESELKNIYFEYIFNCNSKEAEEFYHGYLSNDINNFIEYTRKNGSNFEYLNKIFNKDITKENLKEFILNNNKFYDLNEIKEQIRSFYSKTYNNALFDINNENLNKTEKDGVEVINLDGEDFNIIIHRIFNFNFDLNNLTQELLNNPKLWNELEGATTISTTLISNSKISGLFRPLKLSEYEAPMDFKSTEEEQAQYEKEKQETIDISYGKRLKEIADDSVFYGFTKLENSSIIDMSNTDNMIEHGKGKLDIKSDGTKMLNEKDLAYWTSYTYWNEITLKRYKENNERLQPTCIVCFDNNINENSIKAAQSFRIPIININRRKYVIKEEQKLKDLITDFCTNYNKETINELFYTLSYEKLVNFVPLLIDRVDKESKLESTIKDELLEEIKKNITYFLNKSLCTKDNIYSNNDKKMDDYLKQIDSLEKKELKEMLVEKEQSNNNNFTNKI